ncbi:MAG: S8 family serine peptidase [Elusimicrobia bacterium]|nr:S8 family serine peptidase [Elusimicrobiota bacterium]
MTPTTPRRSLAAVLALSLIAAAPGLEPYRVAARELAARPVAAPAAGQAGASARPGALGLGSRLAELGLPPSALGLASLAPPGAVLGPGPAGGLAAGAPGLALAAGSPAAAARPSALAPAAGSLLDRLLSRPAQAGRAAEPTRLGRLIGWLEAPGLAAGEPAGEDGGRLAAEADFLRRRGEAPIEGLAPALSGEGSAAPAAPRASVALGPAGRPAREVEGRESGTLALEGPAPQRLSIAPARPRGPQHRSTVFPVMVAAAATVAAWVVTQVAPVLIGFAVSAWAGSEAVAQVGPTGQAVWALVSAVIFAGTSLLGLYALTDAGLLAGAIWRGKTVSASEFHAAVKEALRRIGVDTGTASALAGVTPTSGFVRPFWGGNAKTRLSYGFTTPQGIYLRPELARTPWLLRMVLRHELYHFVVDRARAPPGQEPPAGPTLLDDWTQEFGSRVRELSSARWLRELKIHLLERVLREAEVSLSLPGPYEVLVVRPGEGRLQDPEAFETLSGGRAKTRVLPDLGALRQATPEDPKSRMIVAPGASAWLPGGQDNEKGQAWKLGVVLGQLDALYLKARGLESSPVTARDPESSRVWQRLENLARRQRRWGRIDPSHQERIVSALWRKTASQRLQDLRAIQTIQLLYDRLEDRGVLFLPFEPSEPGVDTFQRLLRYWEAADGGRLSLSAVHLPEGGHVLVARKVESRVNLWLKPQAGRVLERSATNVEAGPGGREAARAVYAQAGFDAERIASFEKTGVTVRHVFGRDFGDNRIFISVPKSKSKLLKQYADRSGVLVEQSRGGYQAQLQVSGPLHTFPEAWKLGFQGEGLRVYDIDTGNDLAHLDFATPRADGKPRVTAADFSGDGDGDFQGHGTHKEGIEVADGPLRRGGAPKAEARMGKVFRRDGLGASDGDILAAAVDAMQWGADVISLSLGSPGDAGDRLAIQFSELTRRKNARGRYPAVTASMGNSGPFNRTGSHPAAGEHVHAIAAAAKSLDDLIREISFFSSVGPVDDPRFPVRRLLRKPMMTWLGGDVTTRPDSDDVYADGIESTKSKDMEPSPSDTPDGTGTRMSGTSMSNPFHSAAAALVIEAIDRYAPQGSPAREFMLENLPFAVGAILQQSAEDMGVPFVFQGAGSGKIVDALKLAARSVGGPELEPARGLRAAWSRTLLFARSRLLGPPRETGPPTPPLKAGEVPWDWIARAKALQDLELSVYEESKKAFDEAKARRGAPARSQSHPEAPADEPPVQSAGPNPDVAALKRFLEVRDQAAPKLVAALSDPSWFVRFEAAFRLANLLAPGRTPMPAPERAQPAFDFEGAARALARAGTNDPDARVRQAAFFALGEAPTEAADEALRDALKDPRPDVGMYAAYALARGGSDAGVQRILQEIGNPDKRVRYTALWLVGRLGELDADAVRKGVDLLGRRVRDERERGNVRHLAVASLTELVQADPGMITDDAVVGLIHSAGPQNLALTRTISKFFSAAARRREVAARLQIDPLRRPITEFIFANKAWVAKPGALGEMVSLLARVLNIPLDIPNPAPDPEGLGVPGVDSNLGPIHLIVKPPSAVRIRRFADLRGAKPAEALAEASAVGLDASLLARHEAALQVSMPESQAIWVNVPDSKVPAFMAALEARGYQVKRAQAKYRLLHETGPLSGLPELAKRTGLTGKGVLVVYLDEGGDLSHNALARERIRHRKNFSEEGAPDDVTQEGIGHGTHGMGIVGALPRDGSPYAGMAPGVDFAVGKVLGANGGSDAMVMAGLEWAATLADPRKTPVIVNLSLGGPGGPESDLSRLANRLQLQGIAVVAARGNDGPQDDTESSPADAALAFKVGAADKAKRLAFYSSRGRAGTVPLFAWLDIGGAVDFDLSNPYEIVSALATGLAKKVKDAVTTVLVAGEALYQYLSGTSMAASHATGKLALLAEQASAALLPAHGELPRGFWLWLAKLVMRTAEKLPDHKPHEVGAGLFDLPAASAALAEALRDPARVKAEAEALSDWAERNYGGAPAGVRGFWLRPLRAAGTVLRRWVLPALTGYAASPDRLLEEPVRRAVAAVDERDGPYKPGR